MHNISKFILTFFIAIPLVFAFGSQTVKQIDEIKNNTGTDIVLNPTDKVKINYFAGEKALQSTVDGELEESAVTNTELGFVSGVTSSIQTQIDSKTPLTRLIDTTAPLQGGGDLTTDRTLSILQSGTAQDGYLSSTDWNTFNDKQDALTFGDLTESTSSILTITGGTGAVIGSGTSIEVQQATTSTSGFLTSTDWNTFNNKQDSLSGTDGDLYYYNSGLSNLAIGSTGQVLQVSSLGFPEWADLVAVSVTTKGDLQTYSTSPDRLPVGTNGQVLSANSATGTGLEWIDPDFYTSPLTTEGDLLYRDATQDTRLGIGSEGQLLTVTSGVPSWQDAPVSTTLTNKGDIQTHNGTANASLAVGTDGEVLVADSATATGLNYKEYSPLTTKGDIYTHDGTSESKQPVGSNGQFLMADSEETNGIRWYDGITTTDWDDTPVGTILAYGSLTPPTGYMIADGSCISKDTYASLFKVLGIQHGECDSGGGAGSGFNIPNLTDLNRFIRAADGVTLQVGDTQNDATAVNGLSADQAGHRHLESPRMYSNIPALYGSISVTAGNGLANNSSISNRQHYTQTVDPDITMASTDSETRPNSIAMAYIIKVQGRDPITSVAQKSLSPDKAGFIIWSAFDGNIEGHLKADGSCVSKTAEETKDYFENVGTTFGECDFNGEGAGTGVNLPDLITDNRFIRAAGGSLAVGTLQDDGTAVNGLSTTTSGSTHTHRLTIRGVTASGSNAAGTSSIMNNTPTGTTVTMNSNNYANTTDSAHTHGLSSTDTETRPTNIAMVPYVRMVDRDTIYGNFDNINSSDLCVVEGRSNDGTTITGGLVDNIKFTEVTDNCNAWDGEIFTATKAGYYQINGNLAVDSSVNLLSYGYLNGAPKSAITDNLSATIAKFNDAVYLNVGDTYSVRPNSTQDMRTSPVEHYIVIQQLPDYEAIVKNLSDQKVECQRKTIATAVFTTGNIAGLTFNNLDTTKNYSYVFKGNSEQTTTAQTDKYMYINTTDNALNSDFQRVATSGATRFSHDIKSLRFKPSGTSIAVNINLLNGMQLLSGASVEICELPDTYVETTKF